MNAVTAAGAAGKQNGMKSVGAPIMPFAKGVQMIVAQVYQKGNTEAPTTVEVVLSNCLCQIAKYARIDTY